MISSSLAKIKTGHLPIKAKSITAAPTSSVRPIETATCVLRITEVEQRK